MSFDVQKLEDFPQKPGVYLMKDKHDKVLYVGKAKNLKNRVRQYFALNHDTRPQVPYLVAKIDAIDTIIVHSEKEALLLENTLIKRYKPKYNVLLKDDKSYVSLKITTNHLWPQMALCRYKGKPPPGADYFGPFTNAHMARQSFELISRLFPLRQCSDEEFVRRERPCLLYQIKRCLAPCVGFCSKEEYKQNIQNAKKLVSGKNQELITALTNDMEKASEALEFEKAAVLLRKIRLLEGVKETQSVECVSGESMDVWGSFRKADCIMLSKLIYRGAKLLDARHFLFEKVLEEDQELMESFLLQHYLKEDEIVPKEIVVDLEKEDLEALEEIISEKNEKRVYLSSYQRGEKKKLLELAYTNAESAFFAKTSAKELVEKQLLDLQEKLSLVHFPRRIECFDNSHFAGSGLVSSMVVFIDGEKRRSEYRKYHAKTVSVGDDYGMLREVLLRRYGKKEGKDEVLPDLIVIDGGKGHYQTAQKALSELGVVVSDVIAVAKEAGRHDKGLTREVVFCEHSQEPIHLEIHSPILHLLQKIRDEAHRFAISFQKDVRKKATIKSLLDEIKGIGPVKKKKLIQAFGSVKGIQKASYEALLEVEGITAKDATSIVQFFQQREGIS